MAPHHCKAHAGLPRVWRGWGELGNRKAELQAIEDEYFKTNKPDYKLRHPDAPRYSWDLHLDVARKWTRYFDWRISKKDRSKTTLPEMVRVEHIPRLLNFFYTGDYSVDKRDMDRCEVGPCPNGCVTCTQICQLLQIHLSMFRTALLLRIPELQGLAFSRFRGLLDTASIWVLQYAVHIVYSRPPVPDGRNDFHVSAIKGLMDYRPELVLPAVLRWCGYFRMNPKKAYGEQEFSGLRRAFRSFNTHLTFGLWLDTVDITPPTLRFPGETPSMICIHPYLSTQFPKMAVDPNRSNYQYVTYLQPLPFEDFSEQRPTNARESTESPTSSGPIQQNRQNVSQITIAANQTSYTPMQQPFQPLGVNTSRVAQTNPMATFTYDTSEISFDPMQVDFSAASLPGFDFDQMLDYEPVASQDANAFDWEQAIQWTASDAAKFEFTDLINEDIVDTNVPNPNYYPPLPEMDFTGLGSLRPTVRTAQEITTGPNSSANMAPNPSVLSPALTTQAVIDWTKATASSIDLTEEPTQVQPPPALRYSLRSQGSTATTVSESTAGRSEYSPSNPSLANSPRKASEETRSKKSRPSSSPSSPRSPIIRVKRRKVASSQATPKSGLAHTPTPRYNLRSRAPRK